MLKHDLRPGESVTVDLLPGEGMDLAGGRVTVRVEAKSGQIVRLAFEADRSIPIRKLAAFTHPKRELSKVP